LGQCFFEEHNGVGPTSDSATTPFNSPSACLPQPITRPEHFKPDGTAHF
jgi:hypothetical protein